MSEVDIKKVLSEQVSKIEGKVAVLLSSGVDSNSLLFECLDQGKDVVCYTFRMDNVMSTDFIQAKNNCEIFGVEHREILLPSDINILREDLKILKDLGAKKKTEYECFWVFLYAYKAIKEDNILAGLGADGHFCLSKSGMIHWKDKIDEYRDKLFGDETYCQMQLHNNYEQGRLIVPYLSEQMVNEIKGTTWLEVNKPREKFPIVKAYHEYFNQIKLLKHTNYQKGDSGISKHFEQLLETDLNTGNFKSVISIYNRL